MYTETLETEAAISEYTVRVDSLFKNIKEWVKPLRVELRPSGGTLSSLWILTDPNSYAPEYAAEFRLLIEFRPAGANIIGASGRVDVIGSVDRANLVYLEKGGPGFTVSEQTPDYKETRTFQLFDVPEEGWYWIPRKEIRRADLVDKDVIKKIVTYVSDYEFPH